MAGASLFLSQSPPRNRAILVWLLAPSSPCSVTGVEGAQPGGASYTVTLGSEKEFQSVAGRRPKAAQSFFPGCEVRKPQTPPSPPPPPHKRTLCRADRICNKLLKEQTHVFMMVLASLRDPRFLSGPQDEAWYVYRAAVSTNCYKRTLT